MALSDDQRALLRLLAQRDEAYEDIGALMGLSVDQVRTRVREALAQLDQEVEPPTPPSRPQQATERPRPTAPVQRAEPSTPRRRRASLRASLPKERRRLFELVGGAVLVILLVLFATGVVDIGGGGSESGGGGNSQSSTRTASPVTPASPEGKELTQAVLKPVNGGSAAARALFGRSKGAVLLLLAARGLEPSPSGHSYAIALARSPTERVPIAAARVNKSGTIAGQYRIAPEALGLLAGGFDQMEITLVSNAALGAAVTKAKTESKAPTYSGTDVLRGKVTGPIVKR